MKIKVELTKEEIETIIELCELINAFDYLPFMTVNTKLIQDVNHIWDRYTDIRHMVKKFDKEKQGE